MIRILYGGVEHRFRSLPITIGRDEDNDLPVDDSKLSRHHCRIFRTPNGLRVEDLGSSNGTFVNGAPAGDQILSAGDTIFIGVTTLTVEWDPASAPPPAKPKKRSAADVAELEREHLRLKRMVGLIKSVASEQNEDKLLGKILDIAIELTGAERGFFFLVTLHGLDFRAARSRSGIDIDKPEEEISRSIAREAVESGRPVVTEDAGGDARFAGGRSIAYLHLRSVLCVPLKVQDGPLGALYLEQKDVTGQFQQRDVPFVTAFCDFAAITLHNARNHAALRRREEELRESRARVGRLNSRLRNLLHNQSRELAGVRADLDLSRQALGLRYDYNAIVGQSPAMRKVLALLDRIIDTDLAVLISGESGTGKELIARAIHYNGPRRAKPFVTVNCAAIPKDLMEAELFGYEAGAFTGAEQASEGLFERADGGTLFLDEVGDLPLETQGKLLRVLEDGEVRRVGGTEVRTVSVRPVTASNRDLPEMVKAGAFREDLYYRLNGVPCPLPRLADRGEDIPALFDHFLDAFCAEQDIERPPVDPEVVDRLQAYPWPGNVRELRNEVQRLVALHRGPIGPDLLSLPIYSGDPEATPPVTLPEGGLKELVANLERRVLMDTMRRVGGNKTRAAALLGLSRLGLRKKLERFGISNI